MGEILLLACGAAVFPTLLAGVVVILSRPSPARLLLAFWLGGMTLSITAGVLIVSAFRRSEKIVGTTKDTLSPGAYLVAGALAVLVAGLMGTPQGRHLLGRWRHRLPGRREKKPKNPATRSWPERVLERGSLPVAAMVGAVINLPGPFYLLALGEIATDHYGAGREIVAIVLFNLIMFALVEGPLLGFLLRPEETDAAVARLAAWLNRNGLRIIAALIGLFGAAMLIKGLKLL